MRHFTLKWLGLWCSSVWAQRAAFLYALWDLNLERAEKEIMWEWNHAYITWAHHRLAFFKALFPLHPTERKAFWEVSTLSERLFERQIAPALPELAADMYAQRAILHVLEENWFSAGYAAWKSWRLLQKGLSTDPLTHQWSGLWQVIFATLPPPYGDWLPGTPESRWHAAFQALRFASNPSSYTFWESSLLYFYALRHMDTLANAWLDSCTKIFFMNQEPPYLWRFSIALHRLEEGAFSQAESLLLALTSQPQIRRFPYPYYWLGKLYLYTGKWEEAHRMWQHFMDMQLQPFGITAQYAWRGYMSWCRGDSTQAFALWKKATAFEGLLWEEDQIAQSLAKGWIASPPDSVERLLWQARWLLHGQAYESAQQALEPLRQRLTSLTGDQRTALYYVYGRLYHRWGREEAARFAYFQATKQAAYKNIWMQAYAAYYLAQLYEKLGDWHNARIYYQEADKLGTQAGRTGIVQKARGGYARVKDKRYLIPEEKLLKGNSE
ncbi:MAG: hypothetical protein RMK19_02760 [Bacteroidia bacterium]|nr:hypothetical protein [Bacteroidia bacterium]MDW8014914.1 hypothetical protein [Bacteroidia bacterium]